jgi:dipeptidyl aminopeptidase/acylaminoacyl peptidase
MTEPKAFKPEDLLLEQRITDVHVLPDHPLALYTVKRIDAESGRYASSLWTCPLDGGKPRRFTFGDAQDRGARWSPDGREIAFLSDRIKRGVWQIYCMPADGGEATQLGRLARGASSLYWRPQGDKLLVSGLVTVDPEQRADGCNRSDGAEAEAPDREAPQLAWRLPYKLDGTGYLLDSRSHLFLIDRDSGAATQLTQGDFDVRSAAWAPDGQRLCLCSTRDTLDEEHCTDIWMLSLRADGQPGEARRLSFEQRNCSSPSWSPDGRWIAFRGALDDGDAQMRLWLIDVERGEVQPLGADSLETMGELHWNRDSRELVFIQVERGLQQIAAVSVTDGKARCVVGGERHVNALAANEHLVYTSETAAAPLELFCTRWSDGEVRQLSRLNDWWQQRSVPEVEYRRFDVPDGAGRHEAIDGWLMRPAGRPARPGPLLVDVHGGPASYVMLQFSAHPYWQILCSRGWSVLALNTVGSSSYGRDFAERLRAHWGELDLPQVLAAIEQLKRDGIADERVAITGASYGGYLSAYAIGHSDQFRAAVVCAPVANMESHFGTSDSGYYADAYSTDGLPDKQHALLARLSPMSTIEKVRTPTLFLQGSDDERCPRGQSEELFVKLRRADGAPAEMVLYPGGSHHVFGTGKPSHRVDIQRRIVDWLERWIDQPLKH